MQLANRAKKFLYLGCLLLILGKLSSVPQSRRDLYWQRSQQILTKLYRSWHSRPTAKIGRGKYQPDVYSTQPLVMGGGDPYIRALMRTITASEANVDRPYHVIYGGKQIKDLDKHPELCVTIVSGPNKGNCSTAAGRYQMLDFTWSRKARLYHPNPSGFWRWKNYSFEAEYQDAVVHAWLSDDNAWGTDIPQLLRQGDITQVLQLLSGTWTSLGYGIETNSMSDLLPQIYHNMLQEELG